MSKALLMTVRFQEGRYHGSADRFHGSDGWPPSPGRLFQALVAAAARGSYLSNEDQQALRWLEELEPPRISAPPAVRGAAVKFFVPNNDLDAEGGDPRRVSKIRTDKRWRPRFFDPGMPVVYLWEFDSGESQAQHICRVAARLYQLGRGVDMAWAVAKVLPFEKAESELADQSGVLYSPSGVGDVACPHQGTLAGLIERHQQARQRLRWSGNGRNPRQFFTHPLRASFRSVGYGSRARLLHFELRDESGFAPRPLRFAAPVVTGLLNAAAHRLSEALPQKRPLFEKLIVGRGAGRQDLGRRIRLVPLPSIGVVHTDLSIRRFLVEIPAECPIRNDDLAWAFANLEPRNPTTSEIWPGRLMSADDSQMANRFTRDALIFRSVTAVALSGTVRRRIGKDQDHSTKNAKERLREDAQAASAVVQALRQAGIVARPRGIQVRREPFHRRGAMAEQFAAGSRFSKHILWHVELHFAQAVSGPLVIGDGRFCGLGLMVPVT